MEDLKSFYLECLKELKPIYFKGDLTEFLYLEQNLQSKGFYISKYENITGFNFLQSLLSQGKYNNLHENLELTKNIEEKSNFSADLAALFTITWNMKNHIDYWFNVFGQIYLDEIFHCAKYNLGELEKKSINELLMKAAMKNKLLAELICEFELTEFVAIQSLDFINEQNYTGFKNLLNAIFNNPKSHVLKTIGTIVKNGNISHLGFLYAIKQVCPEVSDDKLLNVPPQSGDFATIKPYFEMFKEMLAHLTLEKRFNFMIKALLDKKGNYQNIFQETLDMYNFMKTKNINKNIDFSDIKNFLDLHNAVSKHLTNISQENQALPSNFSNLHNKSFNEYIVKIPQENQDLVNVGKAMSICVGAGVYLSRILMRKCDIVFLYQNQMPKICIELSMSGDIIQIKGHNNDSIDSELTQQIQLFLNSN